MKKFKQFCKDCKNLPEEGTDWEAKRKENLDLLKKKLAAARDKFHKDIGKEPKISTGSNKAA